MSGRNRGDQGLAKQFTAHDLAVPDRQRHDRHIQVAGTQAVHDPLRRQLADVEVNLRIERAVAREHVDHRVRQDCRDHSRDEYALILGLQRIERLARNAHLAQDGFRFRSQSLAVTSQADGAPKPVEQRNAQFRFEFLDLLRERRLGHTLFLGSADEAPGARDGQEIAELMEFHLYFDCSGFPLIAVRIQTVGEPDARPVSVRRGWAVRPVAWGGGLRSCYTDPVKFETLAIHSGRHVDPLTKAVAQPIHLSSTFERDPDGEYTSGFSYSRDNNPNRKALETCLAVLEGGKEGLAFASGLAVATAVLQGLQPGDHVIVPDDAYWALRKVIGDVFAHAGLVIDYVDMTNLDAVRAAIRPTTRLVWMESPSNPLLKITDLAAVSAIAREAKAISLCDGTFASPVLQRPLDHGVDLVMHSTTKYIGGHSDVVGGILVTKHDSYLFERVSKSQKYGGAVPSPFDCWLALRGVDTLAYRVRAHSEHARILADYLQAHPLIEKVYYPGLAEHPGHAAAARQMHGGFGGMLSILVKGGRAEAVKVAASVRVFIRATSLGGTHSLIEHRASVEGPTSKTPQNLLRLSVGLEHPDDLMEDLDAALRAK